MKTRTIVLAAAFFASSFAVYAQDPVMGVKDPESLFKDTDPTLNRNKQAALHIERELLQCNQWNRAGEWLTDRYIQHNPNASNGLEGVVYYFTKVMNRKPVDDCGPLKAPVVAVMADGPYVTVLTARELDDPRTPGKKYSTSWFDTWRFVDGKADEHWDPATINPPPAK
jgi:predicted SnoaL-like aldol condensation-catalyzing enzyme